MQETISAIDSSVNSPDWYQRALARVSFPGWKRIPWLTVISLAIVAVVLLLVAECEPVLGFGGGYGSEWFG